MRNFEEIKKDYIESLSNLIVLKKKVDYLTKDIDEKIDLLAEDFANNSKEIERLYLNEVNIEASQGYTALKDKVFNLRIEIINSAKGELIKRNLFDDELKKLFEECSWNLVTMEKVVDLLITDNITYKIL